LGIGELRYAAFVLLDESTANYVMKRTCKTLAVVDGFRMANVACMTAAYDHSIIVNFPKSVEYRRVVNEIVEVRQTLVLLSIFHSY